MELTEEHITLIIWFVFIWLACLGGAMTVWAMYFPEGAHEVVMKLLEIFRYCFDFLNKLLDFDWLRKLLDIIRRKE